MIPQTLQPYILFESHNTLGHNSSTRLYNVFKRHYYWRRIQQYCNKYVHSCPECQQITLKEPYYVNLHLSILQFPMFFISIDILGQYCETENGNQYALTVQCMLTNYVFMIPI